MSLAFRSFAILSVLISAALAQNAQNTSDPFIPSDISSTCYNFLNSLNNNPDLAPCTAPFLSALAPFAPDADATSVSASTISTALTALCTSNESSCPQSTVTAQLSAFYQACPKELTSNPNQVVQMNYDAIYTMIPLKQAICSTDGNGNYCATKLANSSSSSSSGEVALVDSLKNQEDALQNYLYTSPSSTANTRRDTSNNSIAYMPNATTFQQSNVVFLFLQPSMSSASLCTTCTKNIMSSYIQFESSYPYASGLANSPLLSGQSPLYNNITQKCGANFLGGAVQAAGGLSSGLLSGAAPRVAGQELSAAVSAILGFAAFVVAAL